MSIPLRAIFAGITTLSLASAGGQALPAQTAGIGIRAGDTVSVGTGQGWVLAIVLGGEGHAFNVRVINGPEVIKRYPAELRRRGKPTSYDRANGIYEVNDRVKVHFQGKWIDSRVITGMGMEYQVELPGNMTAWAKPDQLQFVSEAPPKDVAQAGKPPRPGLVSCAGRIEGRYAASTGMPIQLTFRSGKVTLSAMGESQTGECWTGDGKLFVVMPGEEGVMEIDINDDGSLQTPLGELTKKGK
jgi:hypothetical protein